jgi:hypothetical protein
MTSIVQNALFDSETASFLRELRDGLLRELPVEKLPPAVCREVRQRLEQALVDLALAGQRDHVQLERYARAQVSDLITGRHDAKDKKIRH